MRRVKPICTRYVRSFDEELRAFVTKDRQGTPRVIQFIDGAPRHPGVHSSPSVSTSSQLPLRLAELLNPVLKRNGAEPLQGVARKLAQPQVALLSFPKASPLSLAYAGGAHSPGLRTAHLVQAVDGLPLDSRGLTINMTKGGRILAIRIELSEQVYVPALPEETIKTIEPSLLVQPLSHRTLHVDGSKFIDALEALALPQDSALEQLVELLKSQVCSARFLYRSVPAEERRANDPTHFLALDLDLASADSSSRVQATLDLSSGRLIAVVPRHANLVEGNVWDLDPVSAGDLSLYPDGTDMWSHDHVAAYNNALSKQTFEEGKYVEVKELKLDKYVKDGDPATATVNEPIFDTSGPEEQRSETILEFLKFSAYYHGNRVFQKIVRLTGLEDYFSGEYRTLNFPVELTLSYESDGPNAQAWLGVDDKGHIEFGPSVEGVGPGTLITNCAADCRVHWHEVAHLALKIHTGTPYLLDCVHSIGDSLAVLHCDPLLGEKARIEENIRYAYAPFRPVNSSRRHDLKSIWYDPKNHPEDLDGHRYLHEQLLTSCHFRLYCALGGDSPYRRDRVRASDRVMRMLLIAVSTLGEAVLIDDIEGVSDAIIWWTEACITADTNSPLLFPADYPRASADKLIRWAFESQGGLSIAEETAVSLRPVQQPLKRYGYDERSWLGGGAFLSETDSPCVTWPQVEVDSSQLSDSLAPLFVDVYSFGAEAADAVYFDIYESEPIIGLYWSRDELKLVASTHRMTIRPNVKAANIAIGLRPDAEKFLYVVAQCKGDPPALAKGDPLPLAAVVDDNVAMRCIVTVDGRDAIDSQSLSNKLNDAGAKVFNYSGKLLKTRQMTLRAQGSDSSEWTVTWGEGVEEIKSKDSAPIVLTTTKVPSGVDTIDIHVVVLIDPAPPDSDPPDPDRLMFYGGMTFRLLLT